MAIRFEYKCDSCGHVYLEQRNEGEPLFFPNCNSCHVGKYIETSQTVIEEI